MVKRGWSRAVSVVEVRGGLARNESLARVQKGVPFIVELASEDHDWPRRSAVRGCGGVHGCHGVTFIGSSLFWMEKLMKFVSRIIW